MDALVERLNADLANEWGNLVNRTISMTRKFFPDEKLGAPAKLASSADIKVSFEKLPAELFETLEGVDTSRYAALCRERVRELNLYIDRIKPWALAKDSSKHTELQEVLFALLEGIRWIATAYLPILPFGMPRVFEQLGVPAPVEMGSIKNLRWGEYSFKPNEPSPIYPRVEKEK
jgi:methionyl-tRNA synthetase